MRVYDDLLDGKEVLSEINSEVEVHIHMCSSWQDELDDVCSYHLADTCGNRCSFVSTKTK